MTRRDAQGVELGTMQEMRKRDYMYIIEKSLVCAVEVAEDSVEEMSQASQAS